MTVRPFVWIVWLFLGPVLGAIAVQWYIFTAVSTYLRESNTSHMTLTDVTKIKDKDDGPHPSYRYTTRIRSRPSHPHEG